MSECCFIRLPARVLAVAFTIVVCGCGSDLVAVYGSVKCEGSTLAGARIVWTPMGGGRPAVGEIQTDGKFQLTTEHPNDGAAPGTYRIRVVQTKDTEAGKLYTNYVGPRDKPLEIAHGKSNEFVIDIREQDGWQVKQDN